MGRKNPDYLSEIAIQTHVNQIQDHIEDLQTVTSNLHKTFQNDASLGPIYQGFISAQNYSSHIEPESRPISPTIDFGADQENFEISDDDSNMFYSAESRFDEELSLPSTESISPQPKKVKEKIFVNKPFVPSLYCTLSVVKPPYACAGLSYLEVNHEDQKLLTHMQSLGDVDLDIIDPKLSTFSHSNSDHCALALSSLLSSGGRLLKKSWTLLQPLVDNRLLISSVDKFISKIIENSSSGEFYIFCSLLLYHLDSIKFTKNPNAKLNLSSLNLSDCFIRNWKQLLPFKEAEIKKLCMNDTIIQFSVATSKTNHVEHELPFDVDTRFVDTWSLALESLLSENIRHFEISGLGTNIIDIIFDHSDWNILIEFFQTSGSKMEALHQHLSRVNELVCSFSKHLTTLDISNTTFSESQLSTILHETRNLVTLNISHTNITSFKTILPVAGSLKCLKANCLRFDCSNSFSNIERNSPLMIPILVRQRNRKNLNKSFM